MKKIIFTFILFVLMTIRVCFAAENSGLRNYDDLNIPIGTFIPVINTQEISTLYCDVNTVVKFISTTDLFLYDMNILPKNTEFYGVIDKINEPIIGTNASMVIKITKLRFIDGYELPMRGYIYTVKGNLIGGEQTEPSSYDKKPSYRQGYLPVLGYIPGPARKMGEHTVVAAGADLLIVLVAPLSITHTITN